MRLKFSIALFFMIAGGSIVAHATRTLNQQNKDDYELGMKTPWGRDPEPFQLDINKTVEILMSDFNKAVEIVEKYDPTRNKTLGNRGIVFPTIYPLFKREILVLLKTIRDVELAHAGSDFYHFFESLISRRWWGRRESYQASFDRIYEPGKKLYGRFEAARRHILSNDVDVCDVKRFRLSYWGNLDLKKAIGDEEKQWPLAWHPNLWMAIICMAERLPFDVGVELLEFAEERRGQYKNDQWQTWVAGQYATLNATRFKLGFSTKNMSMFFRNLSQITSDQLGNYIEYSFARKRLRSFSLKLEQGFRLASWPNQEMKNNTLKAILAFRTDITSYVAIDEDRAVKSFPTLLSMLQKGNQDLKSGQDKKTLVSNLLLLSKRWPKGQDVPAVWVIVMSRNLEYQIPIENQRHIRQSNVIDENSQGKLRIGAPVTINPQSGKTLTERKRKIEKEEGKWTNKLSNWFKSNVRLTRPPRFVAV